MFQVTVTVVFGAKSYLRGEISPKIKFGPPLMLSKSLNYRIFMMVNVALRASVRSLSQFGNAMPSLGTQCPGPARGCYGSDLAEDSPGEGVRDPGHVFDGKEGLHRVTGESATPPIADGAGRGHVGGVLLSGSISHHDHQ